MLPSSSSSQSLSELQTTHQGGKKRSFPAEISTATAHGTMSSTPTPERSGKRRRLTTFAGTVLNTAVETAFTGAAIGIAVYNVLWSSNKDTKTIAASPEDLEPPPPYVECPRPASPAKAQVKHVHHHHARRSATARRPRVSRLPKAPAQSSPGFPSSAFDFVPPAQVEEEDDDLARMNSQIQALINSGTEALSSPIPSPKKKQQRESRRMSRALDRDRDDEAQMQDVLKGIEEQQKAGKAWWET